MPTAMDWPDLAASNSVTMVNETRESFSRSSSQVSHSSFNSQLIRGSSANTSVRSWLSSGDVEGGPGTGRGETGRISAGLVTQPQATSIRPASGPLGSNIYPGPGLPDIVPQVSREVMGGSGDDIDAPGVIETDPRRRKWVSIH